MGFEENIISNEIQLLGKKIKLSDLIFATSTIVAIIFFSFTTFILNITDIYSVYTSIIISVNIIIIPYMIFQFVRRKYFNNILEHYPSFLRNLSEATRSGMSLISAFKTMSQGDYGYLTNYIKKLYCWLSWGIPFEKAFKKFTEKMKDIEIISRINDIIIEAYKSGGEITKVLSSVAKDLEDLRELEKDKSVRLNQQILILYIIFLIFAGILVIIINSLTPLVVERYSTTSLFGGRIDIEYLKSIATLSLFVQAACIGLVIGLGVKPEAGALFKHLPILLIIAGIISILFIMPPTVSFTVYVTPGYVYSGEEVTIYGDFLVNGKPVESLRIDIYIDSEILKTYTDSSGHFEIKYKTSKKGEFDIKAIAEYNGKKYTSKATLIVE